MVSAETLISYPDQKLAFTVHTDASDKQVGAVISHNNKPIAFFSIILSKPQRNYTMNEKKILAIVECLEKFREIIFGYEINVFSYNKNMGHVTTISESQLQMRYRLILKEFGPNIHHVAVVDNIVCDTLSKFPSRSFNKYEPSAMKSQC